MHLSGAWPQQRKQNKSRRPRRNITSKSASPKTNAACTNETNLSNKHRPSPSARVIQTVRSSTVTTALNIVALALHCIVARCHHSEWSTARSGPKPDASSCSVRGYPRRRRRRRRRQRRDAREVYDGHAWRAAVTARLSGGTGERRVRRSVAGVGGRRCSGGAFVYGLVDSTVDVVENVGRNVFRDERVYACMSGVAFLFYFEFFASFWFSEPASVAFFYVVIVTFQLISVFVYAALFLFCYYFYYIVQFVIIFCC